ncbi:MAG: glycosyltransferase [Verrucomicrobiota bacterium]
MPLCIVIPAKNEATRLGAGLAVLAESLRAQGLTDAQVIVADNGSTDETRSVAERQANLFIRPLIYLRAAEIGDKGLAIRRGWESAPADCEVLAYCDADMATNPRALGTGYALIRAGTCDAVAGSRWHDDSEVRGRSLARSFVSSLLSFFWRWLPGVRVTDPGCGLKLVRRSSFVTLALPDEARGFSFGAEVLVRLARAGGRIREIPVVWTDDDAGRIRLGKTGREYAATWWRLLRR